MPTVRRRQTSPVRGRRSGIEHRRRSSTARAAGWRERLAAASTGWPDALEVPKSQHRHQLLGFGMCVVAGWIGLIGAAASALS